MSRSLFTLVIMAVEINQMLQDGRIALQFKSSLFIRSVKKGNLGSQKSPLVRSEESNVFK